MFSWMLGSDLTCHCSLGRSSSTYTIVSSHACCDHADDKVDQKTVFGVT